MIRVIKLENRVAPRGYHRRMGYWKYIPGAEYTSNNLARASPRRTLWHIFWGTPIYIFTSLKHIMELQSTQQHSKYSSKTNFLMYLPPKPPRPQAPALSAPQQRASANPPGFLITQKGISIPPISFIPTSLTKDVGHNNPFSGSIVTRALFSSASAEREQLGAQESHFRWEPQPVPRNQCLLPQSLEVEIESMNKEELRNIQLNDDNVGATEKWSYISNDFHQILSGGL